MDEAIDQYRAPDASVETPEIGLPFFVVGTTKFVVLFLSTFTIYMLYWWYRQWRQQRDIARVSANPVLRAIFSIFFAHVLFRNANNLAISKGVKFDAAPGLLAGTYILSTIAQNILLREGHAHVADFARQGDCRLLGRSRGARLPRHLGEGVRGD